ncbi:MAG: DUF3575 domain-containing protein [Rikenellaceae bacterium]
MKKIFSFAILFGILMVFPSKTYSQVSAVKINAPTFIVGLINVELETALSPSFSMNLSGTAAPWGRLAVADNHFINYTFQPGFRYWFRGLYTGPFIGGHFTGTYTEASFKGKDYRGFAAGVGLSGGYAWMLTPRWNLELEVGLSAMGMFYDERPEGGVYPSKRLSDRKITLAPTKAGLNIVYLF